MRLRYCSMNQAARDPTLSVFVNLLETVRMDVLAVAAVTAGSGFGAYTADVVERRMQMDRGDWEHIHKSVDTD